MSDTRISLEESCRRLKENDSTLVSLNLSGIQIGDAGCMALGFALKHNEFLKELNLANASIGPDGASQLAVTFRTNYTLERLYIMGNSISDKGAENLASALKVNASLRLLNLARNSVGDIGCAALAEALLENATLYKLYLYENTVGNHGASALAETITQNRTLQELFIWENQIGSDGLDELERAFNSVQKAGTSFIQLKTQWKTEGNVTQQAKPKMRSFGDDIIIRTKERATQIETEREAVEAGERGLITTPARKTTLENASSPASTTMALPKSSDLFAKLRAKAQSLEPPTPSTPRQKFVPDASSFALMRAKAQSVERGTSKTSTTLWQPPVVAMNASKAVAGESAIASVSVLTADKSVGQNAHCADRGNGHSYSVTNTFDFSGLRAKARTREMQQLAKDIKASPSRFNTDASRSWAEKVEAHRFASTPKTSLSNFNQDALRSKVSTTEHSTQTKHPVVSCCVTVKYQKAKVQSVKEGITKKPATQRTSTNYNFTELRQRASTRETRQQAIVSSQVSPRLLTSSQTMPPSAARSVKSENAVDAPTSGSPEERVSEDGTFSFSQLMAKATALEARANPALKKSFR